MQAGQEGEGEGRERRCCTGEAAGSAGVTMAADDTGERVTPHVPPHIPSRPSNQPPLPPRPPNHAMHSVPGHV